MKDRNFLDTVMEFEQQLESVQQQFSELKHFVAHMMEEHQTLQTENFHLRKRLEELLSKEQPSTKTNKKKDSTLDIGAYIQRASTKSLYV